jgi:hypothetical protein
MGYYLAIKKSDMLSFATNWMEPEDVMFSAVSLTQKGKSCTASVMRGSWKSFVKQDADWR